MNAVLIACILAVFSGLWILQRKRRAKPINNASKVQITYRDSSLHVRKGSCYIPSDTYVDSIKKRTKEKRLLLQRMWKEEKDAFQKIWQHVGYDKRLFILTVIHNELVTVLEPYFDTNEDIYSLISNIIDIKLLASDELHFTAFSRLVDIFTKDAILTSSTSAIMSACETEVDFDPGKEFTVDSAAVSKVSHLVSSLHNYAITVFLVQVMQRYFTDTRTGVYIYNKYFYMVLMVLCAALAAICTQLMRVSGYL